MEQDRLEIQKKIAHAFTKKTGIYVRVVPVQENLLAERVASAYVAGSLPDVIFHPIDFTIGWTEAGILDDQSATDVLKYLGKETFGAGPLAGPCPLLEWLCRRTDRWMGSAPALSQGFF